MNKITLPWANHLREHTNTTLKELEKRGLKDEINIIKTFTQTLLDRAQEQEAKINRHYEDD